MKAVHEMDISTLKRSLHAYVDGRDNSGLKNLLANANPEVLRKTIDQRTYGGTALCKASALKGDKECIRDMIESLLHYGADYSIKDDHGYTPLHIAASNSDTKLMEIIMSHTGLPPRDIINTRSSYNQTPLHAALKVAANEECITAILNWGADCSIQDNNGDNAFHIAAQAAILFPEATYASLVKMLRFQTSDAAKDRLLKKENLRGCKPCDILKIPPSGANYDELQFILRVPQESSTHFDVAMPEEEEEEEWESSMNLSFAISDGLLDAKLAGGKKSLECTLILTEGVSAKSFARAGISSLDDNAIDKYGVYPLQGKLLNVRGMASEDIQSNKEIQNIAAALGLQIGVEYETALKLKELRYGHVILMTDQDVDGAHIKGLLMNMFQILWPVLLKMPLFLQDFTTYVVKGKHRWRNEKVSFKSYAAYERWTHDAVLPDWHMKYFKGLATNTDKEAAEYFQDMGSHLRYFYWPEDSNDNAMDLAFNKNRADDRKTWILDRETKKMRRNPDYSTKFISYGDFFEMEFIIYYIENLRRAIPSVFDGLKRSERKVLFTFLEKDTEEKERKVFEASGFVSQNTAYHHAEKNLDLVIIKLAQNFTGSNNINLLEPIGQFGSRTEGGKDHGSSKYINTAISSIASFIFPKEDYPLLTYLNEDGIQVEPQWYVPVIPMILVNGCFGISCGFKTNVPSFNPIDLVNNIRRKINYKPYKNMIPWFRNFQGSVIPQSASSFTVKAKYHVQDNIVKIDDLPPSVWYDNYERRLNSLIMNDEIKDYKKGIGHGANQATFEVNLGHQCTDIDELEKKLGLVVNISTKDMYLLNSKGHVKYYEDIAEVLDDFFLERYALYNERKKTMLSALMDNWLIHGSEIDDAKENLCALLMKKTSLHQSSGQISSDPLEEEKSRLASKIRAVREMDVTDMWEHDLKKFEMTWMICGRS